MRLTHYCWTGIVLLLMAGTSCKKEQKRALSDEKITDQNSVSKNAEMMACMYGMVAYYGNGSQTDSLTDYTYVSNGVARLGNSPYPGTYWTSLHTWSSHPEYCRVIPPAIAGDTVSFSVRLKNPSTGAGSVSAWDVGLFMVGSQNTAGVSLIGNTINQQYTYLKAGPTIISNQSSLVRKFDNWTVVTLRAVKIPNSPDYSLSVSLDGNVIQSITYPPTSAIGEIIRLEIAFKGSGSVDWFRVSSSNSGLLRFRNEFEDVSAWGGLEWFYY